MSLRFIGESFLKKILFLLPLMMATGITFYAEITTVTLESSVIKVADGVFINANEIEFMRKFRRKILEDLFGELLGHQRRGKYVLHGKHCSIEMLARIEKEVAGSKNPKDLKIMAELQELLVHAKADFIVNSAEFIENGRAAKNIMVVLIQEDCQKRYRADSLLLEWAKTKEGQESTMFSKQVTTFNLYYQFLTDLANFLLDLTHSCPKAEAQFKARVAKWGAVRAILPAILKKAHVKEEQINEIEFLKYLKERYIDSLNMNDIVPEIIVPLLKEYIKHTNTHA